MFLIIGPPSLVPPLLLVFLVLFALGLVRFFLLVGWYISFGGGIFLKLGFVLFWCLINYYNFFLKKIVLGFLFFSLFLISTYLKMVRRMIPDSGRRGKNGAHGLGHRGGPLPQKKSPK